jgi:methionine-rich copper-binding protein CopC
VKLAVLLAGVVLLVVSPPAFAHHSFAATYFEDQRATIEGTLVEFGYRSPHSFVTVDVTDPKTEQAVRWTIEWGSAQRLGRAGVNPDTLKPGDHVTILGHPGRNPNEHRLHMWGIARASDGWKWGHAID